MAIVAKGNEILFRILTTVATKQPMMNFQLLHVSADLTSPIVTAQNLESERF
jgi:hypothetical protein